MEREREVVHAELRDADTIDSKVSMCFYRQVSCLVFSGKMRLDAHDCCEFGESSADALWITYDNDALHMITMPYI